MFLPHLARRVQRFVVFAILIQDSNDEFNQTIIRSEESPFHRKIIVRTCQPTRPQSSSSSTSSLPAISPRNVSKTDLGASRSGCTIVFFSFLPLLLSLSTRHFFFCFLRFTLSVHHSFRQHSFIFTFFFFRRPPSFALNSFCFDFSI